MEWLAANWDICLLVFVIIEKAIKASPSQYDDIILDVVWDGIKKVLKKK